MNVLLKLNDGIGVNLGPNFAIKANIGTVTPSTLTKTALLAGTLVSVDDLATAITVESTGDCTNSLTLNITSPTTTTTTPAPTTTTTTTTAAPTTTTTTTAAPTTTTTTNNLPTTTTTAAPTTTTTTAAVSFSTSGGCSNGSDGVGAMISFNGGSGEYQASDTTYVDSSSALAGTYTDVVATRTFTGLATGTYWVALRDKNNTSNKNSNSFAITVCPTTTTTTEPPVTYDISYTCTGTTQTITINNFAGGDGSNYYASTTTYADAGSAGAGATTLVTGGTRSYTTQPSSYGVSTRYVKVVSSTKSLVKSAGVCCDNAANWVYQNNTTCVSCANLPVYRDTNPCSSTYNYYKIDTGGTPQVSQPSYGACVTDASYTYGVGNYYTCSNGVITTTAVYQNTNSCFTGDQYKAGVTTYATNPANSYPNTSANWVNYAQQCYGYDLYYIERDVNQCSPTWGATRQGSLIEANSATCGYLPPVTYDISAVCTGTTQTITINNFAGGNGTYYANTTTYGDPSSASSGATSVVSGSRTYTDQPSGTRYVYVSSGYRNLVKSAGFTCTTTTTTTVAPTTTTTTAAPYDIYLMLEYTCNGAVCEATGLEKYGAFPVGFSPNYTRYYKPATPTGFAYQIETRFQSGTPAIIMNSTSNISCETQAGCV